MNGAVASAAASGFCFFAAALFDAGYSIRVLPAIRLRRLLFWAGTFHFVGALVFATLLGSAFFHLSTCYKAANWGKCYVKASEVLDPAKRSKLEEDIRNARPFVFRWIN